jgi:hypothetical protein
MSGMWRLACFGIAIGLLFVPSNAIGGKPWLRYEQKDIGLSVSYPAGWHVIDHPLTDCTDPAEVVDLGGPGRALFMLQEAGSGRGLAPRPERFRLVGDPTPGECCTPTNAPGWVIPFQDAGRSFYAYLYPGSDDRRGDVLGILNSLEVRPR